MRKDIFTGCVPALMTPCDRQKQPNFDALVEKGLQLIEHGMSAVVYCGSMGDWPLVSDLQRMEGVSRLVDAGVPVIVGTGAINSQSAVEHAKHAQKVGAQGLMVIPRVLSRGTSLEAQKHHFKAILDAASDLPAIIYNSPYYGFATRADLFFSLRAEHPNLIGFKEFGGFDDLRYASEFITSQDSEVMLVIGVDTAVYHGFINCGASGAITGIGNVMPKEVLLLADLCKKAASGDATARRLAKELDEAMATLASFDEGVDLVLYYKHLMVVSGDENYIFNFNETDRLSDAQRHYAESQYVLFKTWFESWTTSENIT